MNSNQVFLFCESYNRLSRVTRVINPLEIDYCIWVMLPSAHSSLNKKLQSIKCVDDDSTIDILSIQRFNYNSHIRIPSELINQSVGKHTYKITMLNEINNEFESYYFSYIIQTDNLDKPYIYMKDEVTDNESNI